jgi:phenylalanyl-tRNA synthetase alpha chain
MADELKQIDDLVVAALGEVADVSDSDALEKFRIKYLGTKGAVKDLMALLGKVPRDQKPMVGQRVNAAKEQITLAFEARREGLSARQTLAGDAVDVTEPGWPLQLGNRHLLMKVVDELTELFGRMGFSIASGPEVEDEFHNFIALNIPESHPARDPLDNFYLQAGTDQGTKGQRDKGTKGQRDRRTEGLDSILSPAVPSSLGPSPQLLLRTQTSTVQIRVMETQNPPIRVVIPGRVYRPDTTDQTHLPMFHQLEALMVDRDVTMVDLKSTIMQFVHAYFGPATKVRFRPSFFPFTEPSAEVDIWFEDRSKWIELGGCGMVHPNVFKNVGIDPEIHTGWAFGLGIERIAMRKYGIGDIRYFVENDVRFLRQF